MSTKQETASKKKGTTPTYNYVDFVKAWTDAATPEQVAKQFNLSRASVNHISMKLRKAGVKLKKMNKGRPARPIDKESLNKLIEKAATTTTTTAAPVAAKKS